MRVTENMRTEGGASLLKLCDFLDEEGRGLKMTRAGELIEIEMPAGEYPSTRLRFVPSDVWAIIAALGRLAVDAQDLYPDEIKAGPEAYPWLRVDPQA